MFLGKPTLAVAISCAFSATFLAAQEAPPGGTAPPRSAPVDAVPFGLPRPGSASPTTLTSIPKVQEELGLTTEQKQQLDALRKSTSEKQRAILAEMQKQAAELNQLTDAAVRKLLDEKQTSRLEQLRLQREGVAALAGLEVMEKLGLNAEQRDKLTKLAGEYRRVLPFASAMGRTPAGQPNQNERGRPAGRGGPSDSAQTRDRLVTEMVAVLTPEQKTKWDELQGAKFEFPAPPARGRGATSATNLISIRSRDFELGGQNSAPNVATNARWVQAMGTFWGPAGVFRYQAIVTALELSDDQKTQIRDIGTEDVKAAKEIATLPAADQPAKIAEINKATQEKLDKVLTDAQKAKLKELSTVPAATRP